MTARARRLSGACASCLSRDSVEGGAAFKESAVSMRMGLTFGAARRAQIAIYAVSLTV